jgi:hypothetical protein
MGWRSSGSDVLRVAGVLEQVRVDVERDRDARVAEDAADPGYVEPEVDDQVAGEGVAQVVEAKRWPAVVVQRGELCGAPERAAADVAMAVGVPRAVANTQSAPRANRLWCLCALSRRASCGTSGTWNPAVQEEVSATTGVVLSRRGRLGLRAPQPHNADGRRRCSKATAPQQSRYLARRYRLRMIHRASPHRPEMATSPSSLSTAP